RVAALGKCESRRDHAAPKSGSFSRERTSVGTHQDRARRLKHRRSRSKRQVSQNRLGNGPKSWLHDLIAYRVANERRWRREFELAHDGGAVRLNGLEADVQEIGDLLVGVTLGDELNDTTFPVGQSRSLPCGTRKEGIQERLGDFGRKERFVSGKRFDSADQV